MKGSFRLPILAGGGETTEEWTQAYYESVYNSIPTPTPYVRPSDWLDITTNYPLVEGDQKFVGLYPVWDNNSNFLSVVCSGNYNVSIYNNSTLVTSTNVSANTQFNTILQYNLFDINTLSSSGYKQAIIVITPQVGQNLTSVSLNARKGSIQYNIPWLDIRMAGNLINTLSITTCSYLESFEYIGTNAITNFANLFLNCYKLKTIVSLYSNVCSNFSGTFSGCYSLTSIPLLNTSAGTNFSSMFLKCYQLEKIPAINTLLGTNFNSMFSYCSSIKTIPLLNTSIGTNFSSMFSYCPNLITIPFLNTISGVTSATMFSNCSRLELIPLLNTASFNSFLNLFQNCYNLKTVPELNSSSSISFQTTFTNCQQLKSVPLLNTSLGLTFNGMFSYCSSLKEFPVFITTAGTNFTSMFSNCYQLKIAPLLDTSNGTNFNSMFSNCTSLETVPLLNTIKGTDFGNMFINCQTIESIPLFNTAAGTVFSSMFATCYSLKEIPALDTSNGTAFGNFISDSYTIKTIPLINTIKGTNFSYMFYNCYGLQEVPLLNTVAATNATSMFQNCASLKKIAPLNLILCVNTSLNSIVTLCPSLTEASFTNIKATVNFSNCLLSKKAIEDIFTNLVANIPNTITVTGNFGSDSTVAKTLCGTTAGSVTITQGNTASLAVGMLVVGTGINTARAVTFTDAGDLVNLANHGLVNGNIVSFTTIVTTTGITVLTPYYVVNANTNGFQVSLTLGGAPIALTNNGSGTINFGSYIVSINPNVSYKIDKPASATGSVTLTHRLLDVSKATLKGWTAIG